MKITRDIPDDVYAEVQREDAELGPLTRVETLARRYLRAGMLQRQAQQRESAELAEAERQLLERAAARKQG